MSRIREVWANNLEQEMRAIRAAVDRYPYIAMDTEFPGVVARPVGSFRSPSDYHYQTMRCNVDLLKIIQIGLTLADEEGNYPQDVCTWQFNFRFSVADDMFAPDSLELLKTAGLDFQRHDEIGIDPNDFAELMITSGLVLTDDTKWISFHSGYDFGYLVKLLTNHSLPEREDDFSEITIDGSILPLRSPSIHSGSMRCRNHRCTPPVCMRLLIQGSATNPRRPLLARRALCRARRCVPGPV